LKTYFTIAFLSLLFSIKLSGQTEILEIRLAGVVLSVDNNQPIPNVEVMNASSWKGTTTDSLGFFKIRMLPGDSILFKSMGYESDYLVLPDSISSTVYFITIKLSTASYELQVVDIYALSRQNQFRYDFIHLKQENDWKKQMIIPGVTREKYQWVRKEEQLYPVSSLSPISALYYHFSQEGKSLRKLAELKAEDIVDEENQKKFNKELVMNLTQYEGVKLDSFLLFLHFTGQILSSKTSYELLILAKDKMADFETHYNADSIRPIIPNP